MSARAERASAPLPQLAALVEPELPPDWPSDGMGPIAQLMALLPDPWELEPGSWVGVASSTPAPGGLGRLFRRRPPSAHLAVRCSALLARGYERVGAGTDERGRELAFGRVPFDRGSGVSW